MTEDLYGGWLYDASSELIPRSYNSSQVDSYLGSVEEGELLESHE